jgi:hypothetical protein
VTPFEAFGFIEMIRDKTGFLVGKTHILEQGTQIVRMVFNPELAPDEVLNHRCVPAS